MRAQRLNLSTGQGVAVDRSVFKHVINRHNVGLAVINTAETPDSAGVQQRSCFVLLECFHHRCVSPMLGSNEQRLCQQELVELSPTNY